MRDSLPEISQQLETLSARRRRLRHLGVLLEQGRKRLVRLEKKSNPLRETLQREGEDVQRLEAPGLTSTVALLVGDRDSQLEREKAELARARMRYDAQQATLAELRAQLQTYERELAQADQLEEAYRVLLDRKEALLHQRDNPNAPLLLDLAEEIGTARQHLAEAEEAAAMMAQALQGLQGLRQTLRSASNWSFIEILPSVTAMKHQQIDAFRRQAQKVQRQLEQLGLALTDLPNQQPLDAYLDLYEDEIRFDMLGGDFGLRGWIDAQVRDAHRQVVETIMLVGDLWQRLQHVCNAAEDELLRLETARAELIESA